MTPYGKLNLAAMFLYPVAATLAAFIVFGPLVDTLLWTFGLGLVPMLIGGAIGGLLLLLANRKAGGRGAAVAVSPTVLPAVAGAASFLYYAFLPSPDAPGFEYLAVPQYVLVSVLLLSLVAAVTVVVAWLRS